MELPRGVVIENNGAQRSWDNNFTRYQNNQNQGHWMEQMRGSLMVVATVIATLTFQIAINPPGGVWQSDTSTQQGCAPGNICKAGTSVLAFGGSNQKLKYELFILLCTISFSASQTIILLLISGFPLRNRCLCNFCLDDNAPT
ncbi:PGG domain [Sesbania bispinosa]|nr:PGG domain [Sesbania bispinosa]